MAKTIIAGNWKMHHGPTEAGEFAVNLDKKYDSPPAVEAVICPPFVSLPRMKATAPHWLKIGAQNMHYEESGAFTGEISPKMLAEIGVDFVIVGHSERRQLFEEQDETVNQKARMALKYGLSPIICVGETEQERDAGRTTEIIDRQVRAALTGIVSEILQWVVFAYEPVWAIGTDKAATGEDAEAACSQIRSIIEEVTDTEAADAIPILYGGSVKPENLADFVQQNNVNGALVGGKSLQAESFCRLLQVAEENR